MSEDLDLEVSVEDEPAVEPQRDEAPEDRAVAEPLTDYGVAVPIRGLPSGASVS